jgi:hypothetical protein
MITISQIYEAAEHQNENAQKPQWQDQSSSIMGHRGHAAKDEFKRHHITHLAKFLSKRAQLIGRRVSGV